jgi:hypothetical protein
MTMMVGRGVEDVNIRMPRDTYDTGKDGPTFNVYLTVVVRDSEGKVIKVHRQRSHSPTANFIRLMLPVQYFINTGTYVTLTNTGNSTCNYQPNISTHYLDISYPNQASNYATYLVMIQVGNSSQSNPYTAYGLASPIANGSGSGQLLYGAIVEPSGVIASGSSVYFYISQTYNNQSGGTINITEVGIIVQLYLALSNNGSGNAENYNCGNILVWYDVLSSPISVPNGGSVTIYYTFTVNP